MKTGREDELLPSDTDLQNVLDYQLTKKPDSKIFNVYTDIDMVRQNLNEKTFNLVNSETEADILFIRKHFKNYK